MSYLPWPSEEKFLERVLRDCEDELVFSLCGVNPVELCENFFERSVISRESYNHFTSMDHSRIKSRLRLRYLVRLISEKIKKDPALWENLIAVLDTLEGVPSSLTDKLKQAVLNTKEGLADDSEAVGGESGASLGEASENEKVVLTTRDVNILTELLVEVSDVWFDIAISLGLLQHEIKNCKGEDNKISIFQILGFWIANNSEPTLKKLTDTLCSEIVARTAVAEKITRTFEAKRLSKGNTKSKDLAKSQSPKSTITPTIPRIVSQSLPTEVADGKSTLLQVQASPRESVSYQWQKDDQPLANNSRYSGVDEDILVVRHACQGTEGEYTCEVSLQDKQVSSEPTTLTVHFPLAKKHLLNSYIFDVPTQKDSWPLVVAKTFINLVLIKPDSRDQNCRLQGISGDYSVRGDADDIIAMKEKITYEDAFNEYKSGELILVEGRPGSGKTTLAHKVVKDWKLGEVLTKSELTFLITLRLLKSNRRDESLAGILQEFYCDDGELNKIVSTISEKDGKGVCFVLDGLDEYCSQNVKKSAILKLLEKRLLPQSMIIVLSRPSVVKLVNKYPINKRIEVFGFSKEQISEYIDNFFIEEIEDKSITKASKLKEYLHSHPNIHNMCYLPIHAAMICFLLQLSNNLSPTQTGMYKEFTLSIIIRHLARKEDCLALKSLKHLKGAHAQYFKDLCHLAYEMTTKYKQVISSQELEDWLGGRGSFSEEAGLGLLTICPTLQRTGIHQNYAFLHLTFQEFLAAYYIANYLDESQQIQLLENRFHNDHMASMWRFYSGLVKFENSEQKLRSLIGRVYYDILGSEYFHYALESQQKCVCDAVVSFYSHSLDFIGPVRASYLLPIEYVVMTSSLPITQLRIVNIDHSLTTSLLHILVKAEVRHLQSIAIHTTCNTLLKSRGCICFNDDVMQHFCELLKKSKNVENLFLEVRHTLSSSARELADLINHCAKLSNLNLWYEGTLESIQMFVVSLSPHMPNCSLFLEALDNQGHALGLSGEHLRNGHLNSEFFTSGNSEYVMPCLLDTQKKTLQKVISLQLSLINFDCRKLACLSNKLSCSTLLQDVDLFEDNICCDGDSILASGLRLYIALKHFNLSESNSGPDCIIGVEACGLKFFTSLRCLDLSFINIGSDIISVLADGYKYMTSLEKLNLSRNNIRCDDARALAGGFKHMSKLEELSLCLSNISSDSVIALVGGFKFLSSLRVLDLSYCINIGSDGATALSDGITFLTTLRVLLLSYNNIGSDGATALASGFRFLTALTKLDLSFNSIGSDGATALAGGFKFLTLLLMLDLSSNNIGSDGAIALAGVFKFLTMLSVLNLCNNKIGSDSATALAGGFECLTSLHVLDLSGNNIGPDGVIVLAGGFQFLTSLRVLRLSDNKIGTDGATALAGWVKFLISLQRLYLSFNQIGSDGAIALAEGLHSLAEVECQLQLSYDTLDEAKAVILSLKEDNFLKTFPPLPLYNSTVYLVFMQNVHPDQSELAEK